MFWWIFGMVRIYSSLHVLSLQLYLVRWKTHTHTQQLKCNSLGAPRSKFFVESAGSSLETSALES
jgi:hypothetical protein